MARRQYFNFMMTFSTLKLAFSLKGTDSHSQLSGPGAHILPRSSETQAYGPKKVKSWTPVPEEWLGFTTKLNGDKTSKRKRKTIKKGKNSNNVNNSFPNDSIPWQAGVPGNMPVSSEMEKVLSTVHLKEPESSLPLWIETWALNGISSSTLPALRPPNAIPKQSEVINDTLFSIQDVDGNGNCLFSSIAYGIWGDADRNQEVRLSVVDWLMKNVEHEDVAPYIVGFVDDMKLTLLAGATEKRRRAKFNALPEDATTRFRFLLEILKEDGKWGGDECLLAASHVYYISIVQYWMMAQEEYGRVAYYTGPESASLVLHLKLFRSHYQYLLPPKKAAVWQDASLLMTSSSEPIQQECDIKEEYAQAEPLRQTEEKDTALTLSLSAHEKAKTILKEGCTNVYIREKALIMVSDSAKTLQKVPSAPAQEFESRASKGEKAHKHHLTQIDRMHDQFNQGTSVLLVRNSFEALVDMNPEEDIENMALAHLIVDIPKVKGGGRPRKRGPRKAENKARDTMHSADRRTDETDTLNSMLQIKKDQRKLQWSSGQRSSRGSGSQSNHLPDNPEQTPIATRKVVDVNIGSDFSDDVDQNIESPTSPTDANVVSLNDTAHSGAKRKSRRAKGPSHRLEETELNDPVAHSIPSTRIKKNLLQSFEKSESKFNIKSLKAIAQKERHDARKALERRRAEARTAQGKPPSKPAAQKHDAKRLGEWERGQLGKRYKPNLEMQEQINEDITDIHMKHLGNAVKQIKSKPKSYNAITDNKWGTAKLRVKALQLREHQKILLADIVKEKDLSHLTKHIKQQQCKVRLLANTLKRNTRLTNSFQQLHGLSLGPKLLPCEKAGQHIWRKAAKNASSSIGKPAQLHKQALYSHLGRLTYKVKVDHIRWQEAKKALQLSLMKAIVLQIKHSNTKARNSDKYRTYRQRKGDIRKESNRVLMRKIRAAQSYVLKYRILPYNKLAITKANEHYRQQMKYQKDLAIHQDEFKTQALAYRKELLRYSGKFGWKQSGMKYERLRKEDQFRQTIVNRVTRVTQTKLAKGFQKGLRQCVTVDERAALDKEIEKEVKETVHDLINLRKLELEIFHSKFLRFAGAAYHVRKLAPTNGLSEAVAYIFRPPDAREHDKWHESRETKKPCSSYYQEMKDANGNVIKHPKTGKTVMKRINPPCTAECTLPKNWEERLWTLLKPFDDGPVNAYKRMDMIMDFEDCKGCVNHSTFCEYDAYGDGCLDGIKLLRKLSPHSNMVRNFLNKIIYPIRKALRSILQLDRVLSDPNKDLKHLIVALTTIKNKDKAALEELGGGDSEKQCLANAGPELTREATICPWQDNIDRFRDIEKDHPLKVCNLCEEMKRPKDFKKKPLHYDKLENDIPAAHLSEARKVLSLCFPEQVTEEEMQLLFPLTVCQHCWDFLRKGEIGGGMRANSMIVDELPDELSSLNIYENFLISRAHAFYTVVDLKPMSGRNIPSHHLLKATKGNAIHLPIPIAETGKRVLDTLPPQNPSDTLQIYADVPTKSGLTWRNLVDVDKVLKALHWLKANNELYKDIIINPNVFDQMSERGFLTLTGDDDDSDTDQSGREGILIPEKEQHILEGSYSVQPTFNKKVAVGKDIETYVQMRVEDDPVNTQATHLDAMSMPNMYPKGRGHLSDTRNHPLRPAEFYTHRLRHKSGRYRRHHRWMHQAYFLKRDRQINQGIFASTKTGRSFSHLTSAQLLARIDAKDIRLENDLNMSLATVKGTKEYWNRQASDLGAMDEQLGPATFFLTLSCAEYQWEDMEEYARKANAALKGIDSMNLRALLVSDPCLVSEYFYRRFNALMTEVIRPTQGTGDKKTILPGPFGIVDHYYWRLEYQARGAPHIHMKLWIKDAPILGVHSEKEVLDFISQHISCKIPCETENKDLHDLVMKHQMHKCTKSCKKYSAKSKCKKCRFGFPRAPSKVYSINGIEEAVKSRSSRKGRAKKLYNIPRRADERWVNDYNPTILQIWKANIDIQYVGESSRILNSYITSYVTKAEKKETERIWKNMSEDKNANSRLKSLIHQTLKDREVGMYEMADELLGNHLHGSSDSVEWLGLGFAAHRKRKPKSYGQLKAQCERDPNCTDNFCQNLIDDYYYDRSEELEDVCLHDIAANYKWERYQFPVIPEGLIPNKSIMGGFRKRKKSVIIKTPYIAKQSDQAELFFHNLLQAYVPHRSEAELLLSQNTWVQAFDVWQLIYEDTLDDILEEKRKLEESRELRKRLEDEAAQEEEIEEPNIEDDAHEHADDALPAGDQQHGAIQPTALRQCKGFATKEGLDSRVATLNKRQREVYDEVTAVLTHQYQHNTGTCTCQTKPIQVLQFISGGAGVGKSKLIETLAEAAEFITCGAEAILAAPTGLAAQNIDGRTIHQVFKLGVQEGSHWEYNELNHEAEKTLFAQIGFCPLIIIDEVSMVSNIMLHFIHQRLCDLKGTQTNVPFGGFNLVVLGDLLQLPPVNAPYCYEPMSKTTIRKSFPGSRLSSWPIDLWKQFTYAELTENMRQNKDKTYAEVLNKLRIGDTSDVPALDARLQTTGTTPEEVAQLLQKLQSQGLTPVCLLAHCESVQAVNAYMFTAEGIKPEFIFAKDEYSNRKKIAHREKPPANPTAAQLLTFIKKNTEMKSNKTGGLDECIALGLGARCMLKKNLDMDNGLCNGAMGVVKRFIRGKANHIVSIEVQFDNGEVREIDRALANYKIGNAIKVNREQFPLCLAYAITIHKSQGLSLDCIVTNLGTDVFASGMAYVTLSRVKTLDGLYLFKFQKNHVWCDLNSITEYNRLRAAYEPNLPVMVGTKKPNTVKQKMRCKFQKDAPNLQQQAAAKFKKTTVTKKRSAMNSRSLQIQTALESKHVRLQNGGNEAPNYCFVNTAVQVLLASPHVQQKLADESLHDPALDALRPLYKAQCDNDTRPKLATEVLRVALNHARAAVRDHEDYLNGQQHDSLEFLCNLIDASPNHLKPMFAVMVENWHQCTGCDSPPRKISDMDSEFVLVDRPDGEESVQFENQLRAREQLQNACPQCSPANITDPNTQYLAHNKHQEIVVPPGTVHVLLKLPTHKAWYNAETHAFLRHSKCQGKITSFKTAGIRVKNALLKTEAAAIRLGATPDAGHYYAYTKADTKGWMKKEDLNCTAEQRFVTNLKNVYYILLTKV